MPSPREQYDWSFYNAFGGDPIPWDPNEVEEIKDHYDKIVGRLERALESLSNTEDFGAGEAMDALSVKMDDLPKKLEEAKETYEAAVRAYAPYIEALRTARSTSRQSALDAASYIGPAKDKDLDKSDREDAQDELDVYKGQVAEAYGALTSAADDAAQALNDASRGLGEQLLDAWDGFVDFLRDNPIVYFVAAVVVGIALLFVPGVGWAILAGMIVGAIFLAIDLTMLHKEGKLGNNWETWATLGMGIVGMVPGLSALRALGRTGRLGALMGRAGNAVPGSVRNGLRNSAALTRATGAGRTMSNVLTRTSNFTQAASRGTLNGSAGQSLAVDMAINVTRDSATGAAGNLVVEAAKGADGGDTNYWQAAALGAATGAPAAFVSTGMDHNMFGAMTGNGSLTGGENAGSPMGINDQTQPSSGEPPTNDGSPTTSTQTAPDGSGSSTTTIGDGSDNATVQQEFSSSGTVTSTTIETPPAGFDSPSTTIGAGEGSTGGGPDSGAGGNAPTPTSNNASPSPAPVDSGSPSTSNGVDPAPSPETPTTNDSGPAPTSNDTTPAPNGNDSSSTSTDSGNPAETTITPSESGNPEVTSAGDFGTFTVQDHSGGHGENAGTGGERAETGTGGDKGDTNVRYESADGSRTTAEFSEPGRADVTAAPYETVNVSGQGGRDLQVDGGPSSGGPGSDVTLSRPSRQDVPDSTDAPGGRPDTSRPERNDGVSHSRGDNEVNVSTESGNARVRKDDEGTVVTTPEGVTVSRPNDLDGADTIRTDAGDLTLTSTPAPSASPGAAPSPVTSATIHAEGGGSVTTNNNRQADLRTDGYDVSGGFGWHRVSHADGTVVNAASEHGSVNNHTTGGTDSQVGITSPDGSISLARDVDGNTVVAPQGLPPIQLDGTGVPIAPVPWLGPTPHRTPTGSVTNGTVTARPNGSISHPKFDLHPDGRGITIREGEQTWRFDGQGRPDPANPSGPPPGALTQSNGSFTYHFSHEGQSFQVSPPRDMVAPDGSVSHIPQRFGAPDYSIDFNPNHTGGNDIQVRHEGNGSEHLVFEHHETGGTTVSTSSGYGVSGVPGQQATAHNPYGDFSTSTDGHSGTTSNGDLVTVQDASGSTTTVSRWSPEDTLVRHDGDTTTAFGDNQTNVVLGPDGTRIDTRLTDFTLSSGQHQNIDVKSDLSGTTVAGTENSWQVGADRDGTMSGRDDAGMSLTARPDGHTHFSDGDQVSGVRNPDGSTDLTVTHQGTGADGHNQGQSAITVESADGTGVHVDGEGSTVVSPDGNIHQVDFPDGAGPRVTINDGRPNQPVISADRTVNLSNSRGQEVTVNSEGTRISDPHAPPEKPDPTPADSPDRRTQTETTQDGSGTVQAETTYHPPQKKEVDEQSTSGKPENQAVRGPSMSRNPESGQTVIEHRGFHAERTGTDSAELTVRPLGEDGPTVVRDGDGNTTTKTETLEVGVSRESEGDGPRNVVIAAPGSPDGPTLSWNGTPPNGENTITLGSKDAPVEITWQRNDRGGPVIKGDTGDHTVTRTTDANGRSSTHLRNESTGEVTTIEANGRVRHDNGTDQVTIAPNGATTITPRSDSGTGTIRQSPSGEVEIRFTPTEGSNSPRIHSHIDSEGQVEARLNTPRDGDRPAESWGTGIDRNGQATVDNLRSWEEGPIRLRPDGEVHNVDSIGEIRVTGQGLREQDPFWGWGSRSKQLEEVFNAVGRGLSKEALNQFSGALVDQLLLDSDKTWEESLQQALMNTFSTGVSREISDLKYKDTTLGAQHGLDRVGWQTFADFSKAARQHTEAQRWDGMQDPLGKDSDEEEPEFTEMENEPEEDSEKERAGSA